MGDVGSNILGISLECLYIWDFIQGCYICFIIVNACLYRNVFINKTIEKTKF